jgi:GxxExxY protein
VWIDKNCSVCHVSHFIYQRCLSIELNDAGISHIREQEMPIFYRGHEVGTRRVDFLIEGKVLFELKALISLEDVHLAQALNYLTAYNVPIGLLTVLINIIHFYPANPDTGFSSDDILRSFLEPPLPLRRFFDNVRSVLRLNRIWSARIFYREYPELFGPHQIFS